MTRFLIIIFAILASVNILISQDDMIDDLEFEEAPVSEESPVYFAFGGGYIGSFYAFNLDDINIKLDEDFNLPGFSGSMFVSGVHGFTSVGIIPNLRLGFFGSGGSMEVTDNTDSVLSGSKLSASITGITIDYGLVLFKHINV